MRNPVPLEYRRPLPNLIPNIRLLVLSLVLIFAGSFNSASALPPGVPDFTNPNTRLVIIKDFSQADLTETNIVRAYVYDNLNNPVVGATVYFTTVPGNVTITVVTDASGIAEFSFSSGIVGNVVIDARIGSTHFNPTVTTTFVDDDPVDDPEPSVPTTRLDVITTGATADSIDLNTVKATITNNTGGLLQGEMVIFTILSGSGSFIGSDTVFTDINGEASISLVSTVADTVFITATVTTNNTPIVFGSPAAVVFVAGPPDLSNPLSSLVIDADSANADGVAQNIVRAHIVDKYGNPVPGQTIDFTYNGTATPGGPLSLTTDEFGNAVITFTSTTAGPVEVSATVNTVPIIDGNPSTVHFITYVDADNPKTNISTFTDNATADGQSTNSVRAHVVDNEGNPMPGVAVTFTIASGDGKMSSPQTVYTDANGDAYLLIASDKVGYVTLTATANGTQINFGSPATVRFTAVDAWVPRVFTPNGDGVNDYVRAVANGLTVQYFNIYNRWGNLLFTTTDLSVGWDGKFKGVVQPNETYLWILVGRRNTNNERVQKRGMISLVK